MVSHSERVLVTGAAGFTGRLLVESLRAAEFEVVGVTQYQGDGTIVVDLCDLDKLSQIVRSVRPSIIVHLAGVATTANNSCHELYMANVVGTANLFSAVCAAKLDIKLFAVASSATVYANPDPPIPIKEQFPLQPRSHYAISKRAVEDIALLYMNDFPVLIVRPFNYTGPGQSTDFLVPKIVHHFATRKAELRLGDLDLYRDFSDVCRVVEAYKRLINTADNSTTVNICSGRKIHLESILAMMRDISGHHVRVVPDANLLRSGEPHVIWGCPAKLEQLVGVLPNPDVRETLRSMYEAASMKADRLPR